MFQVLRRVPAGVCLQRSGLCSFHASGKKSLSTCHVKLVAKRPLTCSLFSKFLHTSCVGSDSFRYADIEIQVARPDQLSPKPDPEKLLFGKHFTDHMLSIEFTKDNGWARPRITPLAPLQLHPGSKVFHYATELFEGMKAYRGGDGNIRLFRPDKNMARMNATAKRAGLPTFDGVELINCIRKLIEVDQEWVPHSGKASLYIRPTLIGTDPTLGVTRSNSALLYVLLCPVGPYFSTGLRANLLADPKFVRSWPGGCGDKKMGSNYAPTIDIQRQAEEQGFQQVLWLFGPDHQITEVGAMNLFVVLKGEDGEVELVTAPLNGLILPGIVRDSILTLAREWKRFKVSERTITMPEVVNAWKEKRLLEIFGSGTAAIVCPVETIKYQEHLIRVPPTDDQSLSTQFRKALTDIQSGQNVHPWAWPLDVDTERDLKQLTAPLELVRLDCAA